MPKPEVVKIKNKTDRVEFTSGTSLKEILDAAQREFPNRILKDLQIKSFDASVEWEHNEMLTLSEVPDISVSKDSLKSPYEGWPIAQVIPSLITLDRVVQYANALRMCLINKRPELAVKEMCVFALLEPNIKVGVLP